MTSTNTPSSLAAIQAYALTHESAWGRDPNALSWGVHLGDPKPYNKLLGPVSGHQGPNGGIWRNGKAIVTWGDPSLPELTFSVAKTYLCLLAGIAFDRGMLALDDRIGSKLPDIGFDGPHNGQITWRHLLQQTSEWQGSLFGLPDQVDHYRYVHYQPNKPTQVKGQLRPLQAPGGYWEYNDVRINQLSFALLHLFRKPLPEVFAEAIMKPIGGSDHWKWAPYDTAWVDIDGKRMPSVPGGTHWGGGVTISSQDQALIGQLLLNKGRAHNGKQVLSERWVALMQEPCTLAPFYGLLVWLNRDGVIFRDASRESYYAIGAGNSITGIDPANQTVTVARWIDSEAVNGLLKLVRAV